MAARSMRAARAHLSRGLQILSCMIMHHLTGRLMLQQYLAAVWLVLQRTGSFCLGLVNPVKDPHRVYIYTQFESTPVPFL